MKIPNVGDEHEILIGEFAGYNGEIEGVETVSGVVMVQVGLWPKDGGPSAIQSIDLPLSHVGRRTSRRLTLAELEALGWK